MIEQIIPGNRTKFNVIKTIYENPEINITSLIKKVGASPNFVLKYVNELSKRKVIGEGKNEKRKKIHVRNLRASFDNEMARIVYSIIELEKRQLFLNKYKTISNYFIELEGILDFGFALVYGSYSRFAATKESDIDILIVGNLGKEEVSRIREIFVTSEVEVSLKVEAFEEFISNLEKPLYQNILKEHVIIYGAVNYIETLNKILKKRFKLEV